MVQGPGTLLTIWSSCITTNISSYILNHYSSSLQDSLHDYQLQTVRKICAYTYAHIHTYFC